MHDIEELALAQECKQEGKRGIAALLLQVARQKKRAQALVAQLLAVNAGRAEGIELAKHSDSEGGDGSYVAILPEPDGSGKGRVVSFRADGFYGHQVYESPVAALEEAVRDGFRYPVHVLDQLALQPRFQKGQRFVELAQAFNTGRIDRKAFDSAVAELDAQYGKEAA